MTQDMNKKRAARIKKSERNMNRAVILLTAGMVAEWYLLMADRFYARGTVSQVIGWYDYLGVMRWIGLGMAAAGGALLALRGRAPWMKGAGGVLAGVGSFFAFTSISMRHYYPTSVTVMCVLVPVLLILGIVYLFYQPEFLTQAAALAMSMGAVVLLGRSDTAAVRACAVLALIGSAMLLAGALLLKKNGGIWTHGGKQPRVFAANADYRLTLGVPALCIVLVLASLFVSVVAFYAAWTLGIVAFALAVYYTIKLM